MRWPSKRFSKFTLTRWHAFLVGRRYGAQQNGNGELRVHWNHLGMCRQSSTLLHSCGTAAWGAVPIPFELCTRSLSHMRSDCEFLPIYLELANSIKHNLRKKA